MKAPKPQQSPSRVAGCGSTRREFLESAVGLAGAALLSPGLLSAAEKPQTRTAVDQVALGKTGLKLSRLGFGTGSNSGNVQRSLGQQTFTNLIHYAYDKGITYIDCAQSYRTFDWIAGAIKGLPRKTLPAVQDPRPTGGHSQGHRSPSPGVQH